MNIESKIDRLKIIIDEAYSIISDIKLYTDSIEAEKNKLFRTNCSVLKFPKVNRFLNAIRLTDIITIGDLLRHTPNDLLRYPNMGKSTLSELRKALKEQFNIEW